MNKKEIGNYLNCPFKVSGQCTHPETIEDLGEGEDCFVFDGDYFPHICPLK